MTRTADITAALRERYSAPEFAFFEEVGDSGSSSSVYADGVAINMWASRGYAITGFEVKVSRSDWLRELKQPAKAEPVIRKCDFFYLVAPEEIFQLEEVPVSWGVLSLKDGKLREKRKAPKLDAEAITRKFVAQMFRRGADREERDTKAIIDKALIDERSKIESRIEERLKQRTRALQTEADKWKAVEVAVGKDWLQSDQVVRAVRMVIDAGLTDIFGNVPELSRRLLRAHEQIEEALRPIVGEPVREAAE